jgi:hypothetical protein
MGDRRRPRHRHDRDPGERRQPHGDQHHRDRVVSGVYGAGGQPTLVVLLAQGPDTGTTSTQFFNDFASGLQSDGLTVDHTKTIAATSDGSNFVCSPASRPAPLPPVSLCGWDDGATIGLVMDVTSQPVNTTLSEAEAARRAGEH